MKKYLSVKDAKEYYSISRASLMKVSEEAGAVRRIGRKILIDKEILDNHLSEQAK